MSAHQRDGRSENVSGLNIMGVTYVKKLITFCAVALLAFAGSTASADLIDANFEGVFVEQTLPIGGGTGSAFGNVPPTVDFSLSVVIDEMSGDILDGTVGANENPTGINIIGGSVNFIENGNQDIATFIIDTSSDGMNIDGQFSFNFAGDFVNNSLVNQTNLDSLLGSTTSVNFFDFGNNQVSNYTGIATAVPEPATATILLGLFGLTAARRRK
ncbi:MAG: hypothetical protein AAF456_16065 [Planctomycetota bacterium]